MPDMLGVYELVDVEERALALAREVNDFPRPASPEARHFFNEESSYTEPLFWFPDVGAEQYFWGFAIRESVRAALGEKIAEQDIVRLPACRALSVCLDAGERGGFNRLLFDGLIDEAQRSGLAARGGIYGTLIGRAHEADGYHRYVRAFLPLET